MLLKDIGYLNIVNIVAHLVGFGCCTAIIAKYTLLGGMSVAYIFLMVLYGLNMLVSTIILLSSAQKIRRKLVLVIMLQLLSSLTTIIVSVVCLSRTNFWRDVWSKESASALLIFLAAIGGIDLIHVFYTIKSREVLRNLGKDIPDKSLGAITFGDEVYDKGDDDFSKERKKKPSYNNKQRRTSIDDDSFESLEGGEYLIPIMKKERVERVDSSIVAAPTFKQASIEHHRRRDDGWDSIISETSPTYGQVSVKGRRGIVVDRDTFKTPYLPEDNSDNDNIGFQSPDSQRFLSPPPIRGRVVGRY